MLTKKRWSFITMTVMALVLVFTLVTALPGVANGASKTTAQKKAEKKIEKQADKIDSLGGAVSSLNSQIQSYKTELAITDPHIRIVSPANKAKLYASTTVLVKWRGVNLSGSAINIELVPTSGTIATMVLATSTVNDGTESVILPTGLIGQYNLIVKSTSDSSVSSSVLLNLSSDPNAAKVLTITTQPSNFENGQNVSFIWATQGNIPKVNVAMYKGSTYVANFPNLTNNGVFSLNIVSPYLSASLATSTDYKFRLSSYADSSVSVDTNTFTVTSSTTAPVTPVVGAPTATLTANGARGAQDLANGRTYTYTWSSTNATRAQSAVVVNNSSLCNGERSRVWGVGNTLNGSYTTGTLSGYKPGCRIDITYVVTSSTGALAQDTVTLIYSYYGTLSITSPSSGALLTKGNDINVSWNNSSASTLDFDSYKVSIKDTAGTIYYTSPLFAKTNTSAVLNWTSGIAPLSSSTLYTLSNNLDRTDLIIVVDTIKTGESAPITSASVPFRFIDAGVSVTAPTVNFSANNLTSVTVRQGTSITFNWNTTNAVSCSSSGGTGNWSMANRATSTSLGADVIGSGQLSAVYSLTCVNSVGVSTTKSVKVTILDPITLREIPTAPAGYTFCAFEGRTCTFTGTKDVIYGAENKWTTVKTGRVSPITCSNSVMGDPQLGVTKACFIK